MPDYPYELARLVNSDKKISDNTNERWYISFWVWDVQASKKVRRRDYEVNTFTTIKERHAFAKGRIREINKLLIGGYVIDRETVARDAITQKYNPNLLILPALEFALNIKQREGRLSTYQNSFSVYQMFADFCNLKGWQKFRADSITQLDIRLFLDYLKTDRTLANVTRNSYLGKLGSLFSILKTRGMVPVNPCAGIEALPTESGRNMAFTENQVKELKAAMLERCPVLWDIVQFLFYGFIRPGELRKLKVMHIDLAGRQIFIPADIAKNGKGQFVKISPRFMETMERLKVAERNPNEYIFHHRKGPLIMVTENYFGTLHLELLRKLGYPEEYTLYSWKHTGVVFHYRAGVDVKSLQEQLRHWSLMETDIYLKSLGLFSNTEIESKSPAI